MIQSICVFCGSSRGKDEKYLQMAKEVGQELLKNHLRLVYGGGKVGLMGSVAETVMQQQGEVIGVIPQFLYEKEVGYEGVSELRIVQTMHQRKALMAELSDAFIVLPGGLGTLEEFFEVITWSQLHIHEKPCGILNVNGYYDLLLQFLDHSVNEQFIRAEHRAGLIVEENPKRLMERVMTEKLTMPDKATWLLSQQ